MIIGTIKNLWRYPVKSLLGEACAELSINERGVQGDRCFAITNPDGKFGSGKSTRRFRRMDGLLDLQSHYQADQPMITFADGTVIGGDDPAIHAALSKAIGQAVTLNPEHSIPHFDAGPLHIVTSASLNWLRSKLPNSLIDEKRFRPNIVIETDGCEPIEMRWIGKRLKVGTVTLQISEPTERCVMTTLGQRGLPKDPEIMRYIAQKLGASFGVYATVIVPGNIHKYDSAHLIEV